MARFSKQRMIEELQVVSDNLVKQYGFIHTTGTIQLTKFDIDRAVSYGRWKELLRIIADLESGHLGCGE